MRAHVPTILLSGAVLLFAAAPAMAEEKCTHTLYGGAYTRYVYQDLGIPGSDRPVTQDGYTLTCGPWSVDNWLSWGADYQEKRKDGTAFVHKGAKEYDATVTYSHTFDSTPLGPLATQWTAAYYAFDFEGLGTIRDDALDFHVDIARPIKAGAVTVSPFLRLTYIPFFDGTKAIPFIRPGLRIAGPIRENWSYSLEGSVSMNRRDDIDTTRFQGDLNWNVGKGLTINGRLKLTDGTKPMIGGGFIWTR